MQDYYHYEYICPYLSQVTESRVTCERGCRICFKSKEEAREYLRTYCCSEYMQCSIAQMLTRFWEDKEW